MQRYFLSKESFKDNDVIIEGEDSKHITRVMRMSTGDHIICCDNETACYLCEIRNVLTDSVEAKVVKSLDKDSELPIQVTIAHGLPKGDKFELVIQKGTELGAASFIPFQAERSIVKWDTKKEKKKLDRWNKISKEASEQSHRHYVPRVYGAQTIKQLIQHFHSYSYVILAYEEDAKNDEKSRFHQTLSQMKESDTLLILVGPEGGFSDREVEMMVKAGAISCALGPRILRSETAPLYALAAISYHFELLG
ncbi:16S rRNA (uracil(1498)-N(3))-methyltransferase [Salipaludibacillus keqinensis]|uniref:Ribosomal RNA small subunit methyltransferase E n=1 Tax=Salipaludibacillus keqinensis TaxID=2045207 RepID=A0A323TH79_9BACI|nr:16S rRNA (uracil(1498)-N(3))-methyltransferase [Salipaludibacillus keqinensis]PYZ94241.1 16S rRNA (uracil(1498)-N(3))-methyltransferase [Salipaludibacillus keqinensis]